MHVVSGQHTLNPCAEFIFGNIKKYICISNISPRWYGAGLWKHSLSKRRTRVIMVNSLVPGRCGCNLKLLILIVLCCVSHTMDICICILIYMFPTRQPCPRYEIWWSYCFSCGFWYMYVLFSVAVSCSFLLLITPSSLICTFSPPFSLCRLIALG